MLTVSNPSKGLLFGSFLYRSDLFGPEELAKFWQERFSQSFSFSPTHNPLGDYYSKEMGSPLERVFFLTATSFPREFLLGTKLEAISWERNWSQNQKRTANVDIGFLSLESFILATTKNYSHRVYLGQGIFADLTYQFQQGKFHTFPWTYPDYLDSEKIEFLTWGRSFLLQNLID